MGQNGVISSQCSWLSLEKHCQSRLLRPIHQAFACRPALSLVSACVGLWEQTLGFPTGYPGRNKKPFRDSGILIVVIEALGQSLLGSPYFPLCWMLWDTLDTMGWATLSCDLGVAPFQVVHLSVGSVGVGMGAASFQELGGDLSSLNHGSGT